MHCDTFLFTLLIKTGSIRIENPYTTTKQLYEFITKDENCNEYNFRRIHMLGGVNRDTVSWDVIEI